MYLYEEDDHNRQKEMFGRLGSPMRLMPAALTVPRKTTVGRRGLFKSTRHAFAAGAAVALVGASAAYAMCDGGAGSPALMAVDIETTGVQSQRPPLSESMFHDYFTESERVNAYSIAQYRANQPIEVSAGITPTPKPKEYRLTPHLTLPCLACTRIDTSYRLLITET